MNARSIRLVRTLGLGIAVGLAVFVSAGMIQPTPAAPTPAPTQPAPAAAPRWEYAMLTRLVRVSMETSRSGTETSWRFCSPSESLGGQDAIIAKFGGPNLGAEPEVEIINGLAAKGWELVSHSEAMSYEAKAHSGTSRDETRTTNDQWWLRHLAPPK